MLDKVDSGLESSESGSATEADHLLLMVNGLFGSTENWVVVQRNLAKLSHASRVLMVASNANLKLQTFDGIDNCGRRLATELRECIAANPGLKHISVVGHSMGGLIARYTLGTLFDPATRLVAGLRPRHFISLATPHLGCGGEGPSQVPFIGWTEGVPLVGSYATRALQYWANAFASVFMRRTGEQFFLIDGSEGGEPLLVQMVEDGPSGHFFSVLETFESRTCYANSSGDHIVGWANASVRHPDELPDLGDVTRARGVAREDSIESAMAPRASGVVPSPLEAPPQDTNGDRLQPISSFSGDPTEDEPSAPVPHAESGALEAAEATVESSAHVLRILRRLQTLPWSRVDTSFRGTTFPYFAHNLIQVTREWLNWEGEAVVQHLAARFAALEDAVEARGRRPALK